MVILRLSVSFIRNTPIIRRHLTTLCGMMSLRNRTIKPVVVPADMKVELTDAEDQLCTLLDDCTKHLKHELGIETSCRIAGGWVRDKLLGSTCNDIDVALTNMMGFSFAEHLAAYAQSKGLKTGTIGKIAQNPEQSKHLETATLKVLGIDIDLVNLRNEEYAENSRIPTGVSFGTPLQDALRRDLTINTLFYNVHTREVEDVTEKALHDLRNGVIRTPLPSRETFRDDPLRILRCIRFASRLGFEIEAQIKDAAKEPNIQEALVQKVARERVGDELSKMLKGRDPFRAVQFIHDLSLYHAVFSVIPADVASSFSTDVGPIESSLGASSILQALIASKGTPSIPAVHPLLLSVVNSDPSCKARLFLAAVLTPYGCITYQDKRNKQHSALGVVLRESVKLGTQNHYLDGIPPLFAAASLLRNPHLEDEKFKTPSQRVALGLVIRDKIVHNINTGAHWTTSFLFSLVQEILPFYDVQEDKLDVAEATRLIEQYNRFIERIVELDLPDGVDERPILDGREVVKAIGVAKPGAWMNQVMAKVLEWHLENPTGTKAACINWLQEQYQNGNIEITDQSPEPVSKKARIKK